MQNQLSQLLLFHRHLWSFQIKFFKFRVFSGLSKRATAPGLRACWQASSLCFLVQMHSPRHGEAAPWGVRVAAHMLSPMGGHTTARRAQAGCTLSTSSLTQGIISGIFCRLEKRGLGCCFFFFLQEANPGLKSFPLHLVSSSKVSSVHYNLQCNFCSAAPLITSDMGTEKCHCSLATNNTIRGAMRKCKMDIKKAGSCLPIISSTN